tara:strand:- start:73 stop:315 length:243 start_codon:yes stop_codon:yes gene_type:complete
MPLHDLKKSMKRSGLKVLFVCLVAPLFAGGIGYVSMYAMLTLFVWMGDHNPDHVSGMSLIGGIGFALLGVYLAISSFRDK